MLSRASGKQRFVALAAHPNLRFEALDRYSLMMFEQPLAKDDLEGSAALQLRVRTPVCPTKAPARRARSAVRWSPEASVATSTTATWLSTRRATASIIVKKAR